MTAEFHQPLTRAQSREIDRRAIEALLIPGIVLMENAGRGAAELILQLYGGVDAGSHVVVCGGGNNGGDGFVIARHLCSAGANVAVMMTVPPGALQGDAQTNQQIVSRMKIPALLYEQATAGECDRLLAGGAVIVDALLGTGFSGEVRQPIAGIIQTINELRPAPHVVAIDVPSGLDCDNGKASAATIRAEHTITFVAPKVGFGLRDGPAHVGQLHVVGIGISPRYVLSPN